MQPLPEKLQLLRARAVAYDEGYKAFCKTREDERTCPYAGNLKQPWQDGWNDAEKQFTEATTETAFETAWRLGRDIMSPPDRNR
jgi:ribosome modulation factor